MLQVLIGFLIVLVAGGSLAAMSISMGLGDPICQPQSLQLAYLTIVLTICSVLTLFFNSSVLRIAKKQLNAIYAQEPSLGKGRRRVSVVCTNCGYKNETFVNTLLPISTTSEPANGNLENFPTTGTPLIAPSSPPPQQTSILPLADAVVLGPLDLNLDLKNFGDSLDPGITMNAHMHINCELDETSSTHLIDETTAPLVRTLSLPTIPDTVAVPVSMVVQPDPSLRPTVLIGNLPTEIDLGCRIVSMSNLATNSCMDMPVTSTAGPISCAAVQPGSGSTGHHLLPRSRSLMTCRTHKVIPPATAGTKLQLFRNLHFARTHMFHVSTA